MKVKVIHLEIVIDEINTEHFYGTLSNEEIASSSKKTLDMLTSLLSEVKYPGPQAQVFINVHSAEDEIEGYNKIQLRIVKNKDDNEG